MREGKKLYNVACIASTEEDGSCAPRLYRRCPATPTKKSCSPPTPRYARIILDGAQPHNGRARPHGIDSA